MTDNPDPVWFQSRRLHKTATEDSVKAQMNKYTLSQDSSMQSAYQDNGRTFKVTETTAHMFRGTYYEPHIMDDHVEHFGLTMSEAPLVVNVKNLSEAATADSICYDDRTVLLTDSVTNLYSPATIEAKCPETLPDDPPIHYVEQSIKQMHIWQIACGYLIMCSAAGHRKAWLIYYHEAFYRWLELRGKKTHQSRLAGYIGLHALGSHGAHDFIQNMKSINQHLFTPEEQLSQRDIDVAMSMSIEFWAMPVNKKMFRPHTSSQPIIYPPVPMKFKGIPMPPIFLIRDEWTEPLPPMADVVPQCLRIQPYVYTKIKPDPEGT